MERPNNMDEIINHQIRQQKIREMKNPTIVMNNTDFENFKKDVESKVVNLKVGLNPTYNCLPIKTSDIIERGSVIVYDDVLKPAP